MKFLTTDVVEEDRRVEPREGDVPTGGPMPTKYEVITLTIRMIGSGDTRKFTTGEILSIVMDRLKEIEPEKVSQRELLEAFCKYHDRESDVSYTAIDKSLIHDFLSSY